MKENAWPILKIEDVLKATKGSLFRGQADGVFQGVSTDSRAIVRGNLFIPLSGDRYDGHHFVQTAVDEGAAGILLQKGQEDCVSRIASDVKVIRVHDTLKALGDLAHFWRMTFHLPVIAITGSSGKTTTKEMAASIIGRRRHVLKNKGNLNNLIGLPLTLFHLKTDHETAILEMGTNRKGEIARLAKIAHPTIGVITNIGPAHLEGLHSLEAISEEKGNLFDTMANHGTAVINRDDRLLSCWQERWRGDQVTFGIIHRGDVYAEHIVNEGDRGVIFTLVAAGATREILMPALGIHNVYNALAAAAASLACGVPFDDICQGLMVMRPVPGRMEVHRLKNGVYLIDDTYNANPASMEEALKTLKTLKGECRSFAILGDMLELGVHSETFHEEIGRLAAETEVHKIFLRGQFGSAVAEGAIKGGMKKERIVQGHTNPEIVQYLKGALKEGDWVLVKGSRRTRMEDVVQDMIAEIGIAN